MDELCRLRRSEGYEACEDEVPSETQLRSRNHNGTSGESGKMFRASDAAGSTRKGRAASAARLTALTAAQSRPTLQARKSCALP